MGMTTQEEIEKYIADRVDVVVEGTDERGHVEWAVTVADDREFWIDTFSTLEAAMQFCREAGMAVRSVIRLSCKPGPSGETCAWRRSQHSGKCRAWTDSGWVTWGVNISAR